MYLVKLIKINNFIIEEKQIIKNNFQFFAFNITGKCAKIYLGGKMRYWIIPANSTKYDYFAAFKDKGFIDWTKKSKYEEGDTGISILYKTSTKNNV